MINNETYLISFETGTSGSFIKTILEQILAQDHIAYQRVLEFPNAHAHDVSFFNPALMDDQFYTFMANQTNNYISATIPYHNKPITFKEHFAPNWKIFFSKFPNGKNIIITFSEEMVKYVSNFRYYKYEMKNDFVANTNIMQWHVDKFPFSYKYPLVKPIEYEDRIVELKFENILFHKEKVLNTLSTMTNRSIPKFVDETYDNYLSAQKQLFPNLF